ncbi:hypothetical protein NDU88_006515 [Pleurodeles waltl]|uniref:TIR domain-containing protein n=1 Tax=Pleurodeles waltl TaxID=8319 RepID=A0AAV7NQY8_PLEWA|nr:hypothetical protein NDU88_006515 [Pleurodeles waltl]
MPGAGESSSRMQAALKPGWTASANLGLNQIQDLGLKEYDAYVSYAKCPGLDSEAGRIFALETLSYNLEHKFGYNLCIFDRDVVPGGAIVEEINSFIDKSRRVIIILSGNYTSDDAMYELESGLYKSLVERKTKVIIIEYNLQNHTKLMVESLDLLKSSSKVKWKSEKSPPLNSRFWKKIRYLMPAKSMRSLSDHAAQNYVTQRINSIAGS